MEYIHSILLGVLQGLTEFLPISSSGHLAIIPKLFKIQNEFLNSLTFDVALHGGTLIAVILFFFKKIKDIIIAFLKGIFIKEKRKSEDFILSIYILIATFPAALAGVFFDEIVETIFRNTLFISIFLIIFGIILFISDKYGEKKKEITNITLVDSIIIGMAQILALCPGVSRSGITITAGLFRGLKREDAAEFSFLLSIPIILGAVIFKIKDILNYNVLNVNGGLLIAGFLFSFISGILAINILLKFVKTNSYTFFVVYRIILGIFLLVLIFNGVV